MFDVLEVIGVDRDWRLGGRKWGLEKRLLQMDDYDKRMGAFKQIRFEYGFARVVTKEEGLLSMMDTGPWGWR